MLMGSQSCKVMLETFAGGSEVRPLQNNAPRSPRSIAPLPRGIPVCGVAGRRAIADAEVTRRP